MSCKASKSRTAAATEPRRRGSKHRMPRASSSNYSTPHQRKELSCVSQGKNPRRQGGQGREETKRILQARHPQGNHSQSIRLAGAGRNQKERERSPSHVEGQDLEKHQRVLQEGHPGQVQDKGGKEGTGHIQEAKLRIIWQTSTRKDQENAFSQLSMGEKNVRRKTINTILLSL